MTDPNPELTLADVTWLTAIARALTRDPALADDLVQDTWLAAKRSPPATGVNRSWLTRVLQRLHLRSVRTETRRAKREHAAGTGGQPLTDTAELIERAELQRAIANCLLELDEPFRSTLMHVAFDERTPSQIAESESVSVDSVRRRLRKARELLKQKLERRYGRDWQQWYAALLPFAELPLPGEVTAASAAVGSPGLTATKIAVGGLLVSKSILVTLATAPLVCLALWIYSWPTQDPEPAVEQGLVATRPAAVAAAAEQRVGPDAPPTDLERTIAEPKTASSALDPAQPFVVRGTVVIKDEAGNRWPHTNGEFSMHVAGAEQDSVTVQVTDGEWRLELAPDREWSIQTYAGLMLDGRGAKWTGETTATIRGDATVALTAKWYAMHEIHVLDAETRQHLRWVRIVKQAMSFDRFCTPGVTREDAIVRKDVNSPIQLSAQTWFEDSFFVGCPGYAWSSVQLDPGKGGRTEVLLERGADLTVRFAAAQSEMQDKGTDFRISLAENQACEWAAETQIGSSVRLNGLPAGRYVLEARASRTATVARREIELAPGASEVFLDVPEHREELVRVAGTIVASQAYDETYRFLMERVVQSTESLCHPWNKKPTSKAIRLSEMKRVGEELRFDAGKLPIGTYVLSVSVWPSLEKLWETRCKIDAPAATDLRFELPAAGEAYVRLLDAESGEVVTPKTAALGAFFRFEQKVTAQFDESKQLWRLNGPLGVAQGSASTLDHESTEFDIELLADHPLEKEVRLPSKTYFAFQFYNEEERILTGMDWGRACKVEPIRGASKATFLGICVLGLGFQTTGPGTFQVSFPELEGFEPIPDQVVEIRKGERKPVRVELQPSR